MQPLAPDEERGTDALDPALADELVALTGLPAEMPYELGSHPDTLRRHMGSLQLVDRIMQTQLGIADVLRSRDPVPQRPSALTLESLAASLGSRSVVAAASGAAA